MRPVIRVNDFVVETKSVKKLYKIYYVVVSIKGDEAECIRCSTGIPNTFRYKFKLTDIVNMKNCPVTMSLYIKNQLQAFTKEIEDEIGIELYLKKTQETIKLLTEDPKVITFYTKGDEKEFLSFEIEKPLQTVLLPNPYKTGLSNRKRYEWLRVCLGRNFNISARCTKILNHSSQEDS